MTTRRTRLQPDRNHPTETLSLEDQRKVVLQSLYDQAAAGNNVARKQWLEMTGTAPEEAVFNNLSVYIEPYTVQDKSLKLIAQEAPLEIVTDIFSGIDLRMAMDMAPARLVDDFRDFCARFSEWAESAYAPRG